MQQGPAPGMDTAPASPAPLPGWGSAGRAADAACAAERSAVDVLGLACRFPESAGAAAFWYNLAAGVDMLTADGRRWPPGALGTPGRCGKVPDAMRFDAGFFAVHGKQAQARALVYFKVCGMR